MAFQGRSDARCDQGESWVQKNWGSDAVEGRVQPTNEDKDFAAGTDMSPPYVPTHTETRAFTETDALYTQPVATENKASPLPFDRSQITRTVGDEDEDEDEVEFEGEQYTTNESQKDAAVQDVSGGTLQDESLANRADRRTMESNGPFPRGQGLDIAFCNDDGVHQEQSRDQNTDHRIEEPQGEAAEGQRGEGADKEEETNEPSPPPEVSWIREGVKLNVLDGNKNIPYEAKTLSDPFFQDDEWLVHIKWSGFARSAVVKCLQCDRISIDDAVPRPRRRAHKEARKRIGKSVAQKPNKRRSVVVGTQVINVSKAIPEHELSLPSCVARMPAREAEEVEELIDNTAMFVSPRDCDEVSEDDRKPVAHPMGRPPAGMRWDSSQGIYIRLNQERPAARPVGRPPAGMRWDSSQGIYIPLNKERPAARPVGRPPAGMRWDSSQGMYIPRNQENHDENQASDETSSCTDSIGSSEVALSELNADEKEQFQLAKNEVLQTYNSFLADDIEVGLHHVGRPFLHAKLQAVLQTLREWYEARGRLERPGSVEPFVGKKIRNSFGGKTYSGVVTSEVSEDDVLGDDGTPAKVWKVVYTDGDTQELETDEVLQYSAKRPTAVASCRGRALESLELFCGTGVVSESFRQRQWKAISLDILESSNATIKMDICDFKHETALSHPPDFIWASPPCTTFSNAAGRHHRSRRTGELEKTETALEHNLLFTKMVRIMRWAKERNPHLVVAIENPRGTLRRMPCMEQLVKEFPLFEVPVDYCALDRKEKKPTYIWTNDRDLKNCLEDFQCDKRCGVNKNHLSVLRNNHKYEFSMIPKPLAEEVAEYVTGKFCRLKIRRLPRG